MIKLPNAIKPLEIEKTASGCMMVVNRAKSDLGHVHIRVRGIASQAHRVSYEQNIGPIPEGSVIRHKCDVPSCINSDHLVLGTHEDNVQDRVARGRSAVGESNGRSKLTSDDVRYIRRHQQTPNKILAEKFRVDPAAIRGVKLGLTWKSVK